MRATRSFKNALLTAASTAYQQGEISRVDLARVRFALLLRPRAVAEAQQACIDEGIKAGIIKDGVAAANDSFDWESLLAFIQALLPIILEIISIFSSL